MKRRIWILLLSLALLLPCLVGQAHAATSGSCGENTAWNYDPSTKTLTVSGTGAIFDYTHGSANTAPWADFAMEMETLVVENGITAIGDAAFSQCLGLRKTYLPASIRKIGEYAFHGGQGLYEIDQTVRQWSTVEIEANNPYFPYYDVTTFVKEAPIVESGRAGDHVFWELNEDGSAEFFGYGNMFGEGCFGNVSMLLVQHPVKTIVIGEGITDIADCAFESAGWPAAQSLVSVTVGSDVCRVGYNAFAWCAALKTVTFTGDAPEFGSNAFFGVTATVYYPENRDGWTANVRQNYDGNITWVPYQAELPFDRKSVTAVCSADADTGKPKLTWDKLEDAEKYRVYRATSKTGTFSYLGTSVSTSYIDTSAEAGTNYYYKVKALDTDTDTYSDYSNIVNRVCDLARPAVSQTVNTTTGKPVVKWETVEGAAKYYVYRSTKKSSGYEKVYTGVKARSYEDADAVAGTNYYYKVKAIHTNSSANSAYSSVVNRVCDLAKPVVTLTRTSSGNPWVKWDAVEDADGYEVWRATSKSGTYKKVKTTVSATSYADRDAKTGTKYYYKVRAIHENTSANSAYSSVKYITAK